MGKKGRPPRSGVVPPQGDAAAQPPSQPGGQPGDAAAHPLSQPAGQPGDTAVQPPSQPLGQPGDTAAQPTGQPVSVPRAVLVDASTDPLAVWNMPAQSASQMHTAANVRTAFVDDGDDVILNGSMDEGDISD